MSRKEWSVYSVFESTHTDDEGLCYKVTIFFAKH